jgi:hypothetical protein
MIYKTHYRITYYGKRKEYIKDGWLCGKDKACHIDVFSVTKWTTTNPDIVNCSLCKKSNLFKAAKARKKK